jgi:hypothetical protein
MYVHTWVHMYVRIYIYTNIPTSLKEYYDYSLFSTCIENSRFFLETVATEFFRKYHDSKAIALKEYYNYSPISTYTESCGYFKETIVTVKLSIYRKQERHM